MKILSQPVQILKSKEENGHTFLLVGLNTPLEEVLKYSTKEGLYGVIKFWDSRRITNEQRKMIFSTVKDIADFQGDPRELIRYDMISAYADFEDIEFFSLSDCSLETARGLINYIMEYAIEHDIPLTGRGIDRTDDIDRYLYMCIKNEVCSQCGKPSIIYSVRDMKLSLCDICHDIAKFKGLEEFEKLYKIYPIKMDKE